MRPDAQISPRGAQQYAKRRPSLANTLRPEPVYTLGTITKAVLPITFLVALIPESLPCIPLILFSVNSWFVLAMDSRRREEECRAWLASFQQSSNTPSAIQSFFFIFHQTFWLLSNLCLVGSRTSVRRL